MDFYSKLPAPARIGIPVVGLLVVLLLIYTTMLKKPAPVVVVQTQDTGIYEAAQQVLTNAGIAHTQDSIATKTTYTIKVAATDQTDASDALAKSGIKDRSGTIKKISCPAPPGFTATKAANERADNCADAQAVQSMLLTAGASAANVKVSQKDNDTLIGPETSKSVLGQVFLPPSMQGKWAADQAAQAIATAIGTTVDNVTLTDDKLQILFSGGKTSSTTSGAMSTSSSASGSDCSDMATATEIATKQDAVSNCYQQRITADLTKLLGGSDRFVVAVNARVDAKSRTTSFTRNTDGATTSRSTDKGDGRTNENIDNEPSSTTGGESKPAGDISRVAISVTLDSNFVDDHKELAVKRLLSTYVDPSRKDPVPEVTRISFTKGSGGDKVDTTDQLDQIRNDAQGTAGVQAKVRNHTVHKLPMPIIAMFGVVIAFLLGAVALMWRRSNAATLERARYESEFRNEQALLNTYAQQDPARYAAELESMFGAPPAQEPTYG